MCPILRIDLNTLATMLSSGVGLFGSSTSSAPSGGLFGSSSSDASKPGASLFGGTPTFGGAPSTSQSG